MDVQRTILFIKFFKEEAHADQFLRGKLFLNRLSYFKKVEEEEDGRRDPGEAIAAWLQPKNLVITFAPPNGEKIEITGADLAAPVSISFAEHDHAHLFCMYAMSAVIDEEFHGDETEAAAFKTKVKQQIIVDERCMKFGPFAVAVSPHPFMGQLKKALASLGKTAQCQLVEYYDDATFSGRFDLKSIPFRKQKRFEYQREYRICIRTDIEGTDPIWLELGDLSHAAVKVLSAQLNELCNVEVSFDVQPDEP
jgi:hypothetical protein